ncbi:DUF4190 domain-containing protein [Chloroflexus sp.]|uniref:DUF4190 domain-containing protein n=1 Tax=Chloroflexus sp. TaxID=1904827 RepID=UPI003D0AA766
MRQCPICGHVFTGNERFCPVCGQALGVADRTPAPVLNTTINLTPTHNSRLAIASLIFGITTWILFFIPLLLAVPAIVCGHLGQGAIKRSNGTVVGNGLAMLGLGLGYAHIALTLVALCVAIAMVAS